MSDETLTAKRMVRHAFEHAAGGYDAAAVLQHEVSRRMLSRLEYMKVAPRTVLDLGSGTGAALPALHAQYPEAALYALDIALAMLQHAQARASRWQRLRGQGIHAVCADIEQLPLRTGVVDMVWSNLALQWVLNSQLALTEIYRVLAADGLLMFTTFGPDTLRELRQAYQGIDGYHHVNRFIDMHDLGDLLVHGGFVNPVMDMEVITLIYADVRALMRDLKAIGAHTVTAGRRPGITPRALLSQVERNYEALRREGRLPATFEIVYGHAWKPAPRVGPGGKRVIDIKAQR